MYYTYLSLSGADDKFAAHLVLIVAMCSELGEMCSDHYSQLVFCLYRLWQCQLWDRLGTKIRPAALEI